MTIAIAITAAGFGAATARECYLLFSVSNAPPKAGARGC
jgi:hypothetical protein